MQWPSLPCLEASNRQGVLYFSETSQHRCLNSSCRWGGGGGGGGGAARPWAIGAACSDSQPAATASARSSGGGLAANGCGWILQQVDEIVGVDYVGACEFRNFLDRSEEEVRGRSSLLAWRVLVPLTVVPGFDLNEELRPPP